MSINRQLTGSEKRAAAVIGTTLSVIVFFSTILHHIFPWVLKVQPCTGVPYTGYIDMFLLDLIPIAMGAVCFYHAARTMGLYKTMMFLGGVFFFSGLVENAWILLGRNHLLGLISAQLKDVTGTYFFTRGFFWWGEMPAAICVGWFFITYACVYMLDVLAPKANIWFRAAMAGLLAMDFDLWLDPVQVHPAWQSWTWVSNETIKILSIPFSNFAGWFLFVFLFSLAFDRLQRITDRWGAGKGAWLFFLLLLGLKLCLVGTLMICGGAAMRYVSPPVNLTIWGI